MSIQITNPVRIAGVEQTIGTQLSLDPSLEADLVTRKCAIYLVIPDHGVDAVIRSALNLATGAQITSIWTGTKAEYNAIAVKDANTQYVTDAGIYVGSSMAASPLVPRLQMKAIAIGNSISAQSKFSGSGHWGTDGELMLANALAGSPMRFSRVTATTRMDAYGVYGYSGQQLSAIIPDLESQVFSQLRTSGVVPDIIVALATVENDIASGASYSTIVTRLTWLVREICARFPGAVLLLCTPRPSFSNNSAGIVLVYRQVRDYMLSLDNGINIFCARCDSYENPISPGTPLGTSGSPIYTDSSVHPNAKGAMMNARSIAAVLARISRVWKTSYQTNSTNMVLSGTGAASGTNVSGTVPTGTTVVGSANATSIVCTAEQPGFSMEITVPASAGPNPADLASFNFGSLAISGTEVSPFIIAQIVSGASNLHGLEIMVRDGATATWFYLIRNQTGNAQPDYVDGDILTLRIPPILVSSITSGTCNMYARALLKYQGGSCTFRVLSQGVGLVS